jgi:hypothetical protein
MPFDGKITMTRLQKLERLRELLDEATDEEQSDCGLCLLNRAMNDDVLRAAGFNTPSLPRSPLRYFRPACWSPALRAGYEFFGTTIKQRLFDSCGVAEKRATLDRIIAHERTLVE